MDKDEAIANLQEARVHIMTARDATDAALEAVSGDFTCSSQVARLLVKTGSLWDDFDSVIRVLEK